ncbi:hypothetical protein [Oryzihumus sp.]
MAGRRETGVVSAPPGRATTVGQAGPGMPGAHPGAPPTGTAGVGRRGARPRSSGARAVPRAFVTAASRTTPAT